MGYESVAQLNRVKEGFYEMRSLFKLEDYNISLSRYCIPFLKIWSENPAIFGCQQFFSSKRARIHEYKANSSRG
jgi:hypothetical protein